VSELIPVYMDDFPGSVYIDYFPFPKGLNIIEPGAVCYVPAEVVAAWDAAQAAFDAAQREMRQFLEQRRQRAKAEILAFGRPGDVKRLERYEQAKGERRAEAARLMRDAGL
jgi:hypothetical protein